MINNYLRGRNLFRIEHSLIFTNLSIPRESILRAGLVHSPFAWFALVLFTQLALFFILNWRYFILRLTLLIHTLLIELKLYTQPIFNRLQKYVLLLLRAILFNHEQVIWLFVWLNCFLHIEREKLFKLIAVGVPRDTFLLMCAGQIFFIFIRGAQ